jgi:hypothetical protein
MSGIGVLQQRMRSAKRLRMARKKRRDKFFFNIYAGESERWGEKPSNICTICQTFDK